MEENTMRFVTRKPCLFMLLCLLTIATLAASPVAAQEIELNGHTAIARDSLNVTAEDTASGSVFLLTVRPSVSTFGTATNSNFAIRAFNKDAIRITTVPRIGILNASPQHPLHVGTDATNGNGAHVTAAGVWTIGSSRQNKTDIQILEADEALAALAELQPVRYRGLNDPEEEEYVGFIAEDVPALVAMNDRKGLSAMDVVAVLTKALQEQQKAIQEQQQAIAGLTERLNELEIQTPQAAED
jgi:hypothetical protein